MMEPSATTLVEPLARATRAGTLRWEPDPTGGYIVRIGENTVNVYDRQGKTTLRVLDAQGAVVDWTVEPTGEGRLAALMELAARQFRNVGAVLTDILQHLDTTAGPTH